MCVPSDGNSVAEDDWSVSSFDEDCPPLPKSFFKPLPASQAGHRPTVKVKGPRHCRAQKSPSGCRIAQKNPEKKALDRTLDTLIDAPKSDLLPKLGAEKNTTLLDVPLFPPTLDLFYCRGCQHYGSHCECDSQQRWHHALSQKRCAFTVRGRDVEVTGKDELAQC